MGFEKCHFDSEIVVTHVLVIVNSKLSWIPHLVFRIK